LCLVGVEIAHAQKPGRSPNKPSDSGRGKTGTPVKEEPKEDGPLIRQIYVKPSEGFLALTTTRDAEIRMRRLAAADRRIVGKADQQGLFSREKLLPGRYRIEISREDFEPLTENIVIEKGKQTPLIRFLAPKYGSIILGLGGQTTSDIDVRLNGVRVEPARLKIEEGKIHIQRVPVGLHQISLVKSGYIDWSREHVVQPGQCDNLIQVDMSRETIALTVKSLPKSEVYLDDERKGEISAEGSLRISDLAPGEHRLRLELDGYEGLERSLTLTLDHRAPVIEATLTPITEEAEFLETFDPRHINWSPRTPEGWKYETGYQKGLFISKDSLGLVKNTSKRNRSFNVYDDFTLVLNVQFINGRGAAWVARAKDENNYYLFELDAREKRLNFYLCIEGKCESRRSDIVLTEIGEEGAFFRVYLEARGNRFRHQIVSPKGMKENLGGEFVDDSFRYGGVGLRGIDGIEMFVNEFFVKPDKKGQ
jgi:hypothetical protein